MLYNFKSDKHFILKPSLYLCLKFHRYLLHYYFLNVLKVRITAQTILITKQNAVISHRMDDGDECSLYLGKETHDFMVLIFKVLND